MKPSSHSSRSLTSRSVASPWASFLASSTLDSRMRPLTCLIRSCAFAIDPHYLVMGRGSVKWAAAPQRPDDYSSARRRNFSFPWQIYADKNVLRLLATERTHG